jgi:hypothetical protein
MKQLGNFNSTITVKQAFGYHVLTILNVTQSFSSTSLITALDIYDTHWKK